MNLLELSILWLIWHLALPQEGDAGAVTIYFLHAFFLQILRHPYFKSFKTLL